MIDNPDESAQLVSADKALIYVTPAGDVFAWRQMLAGNWAWARLTGPGAKVWIADSNFDPSACYTVADGHTIGVGRITENTWRDA